MALENLVLVTVLIVIGFFSSFRAYLFNALHPAVWSGNEQIWIEVGYWCLGAILVLWLLVKRRAFSLFINELLAQKSLMLFLLLSASSIVWSSAAEVTALKVFVLIAATWISAYIGLHSTIEKFLRCISVLAIALLLGTEYFVSFDAPIYPGIQRFYGPDVWRGVFWNKNHLGSIAAILSALLALRVIDSNNFSNKLVRTFHLTVYFCVLFLVFKSTSTTGAILAISSHMLIGLIVLWIFIEKRLTSFHYAMTFLIGVAGFILLLLNLDLLFGLFGKDTNLSGRIVLWKYLIFDVAEKQPLLGYGLGALWSDGGFRQAGTHLIGTEPVISDSGFVDILLGVGAIGLIALISTFIFAVRSAFLLLRHNKTIGSAVPLLILFCAVVSNLTFSLLLETEVLVWSLVVFSIFAGQERAIVNKRLSSEKLSAMS